MKIKSAHIDGFGKWHDQDFDFSASPQVIFGSNEAGKTTLATFIRSILFGFANAKGKNRYQQYKPRATSTYGGSILVEDHGTLYRIRRTAGKGGGLVTVTDMDGHRFGEDKLAKMLANVDQDLYQAVFSFNQEKLANIKDLNPDEVHHQLKQVGAVGSRQWDQLIASLVKRGDELYKPRGRKPQLNRHLDEYRRLTQQVAQANRKYDQYVAANRDQQRQKAAVQKWQQEETDLTAQVNRLDQLSRLWPIYDAWKKGQPQAAMNNGVAPDDVEQVNQLRGQFNGLTAQLGTLRDESARLQKDVTQFDQDELADYHQHRYDYQRLQTALLQLQSRDDQYHQQQGRIEQLFAERNRLQRRYGHQLPKPLSEQETVTLQSLLGDYPVSATRNRRMSAWLLGLGAALFILGMFGHHGVVMLMGLIVLAATGAWLYKANNEASRSTNHQQASLQRFGRLHGLTNFPVSEWLPMQADLYRVAELDQQIANSQATADEIKTRLAELQRRLTGKASGQTPAELSQHFNDWLSGRASDYQEWQRVTRQLENSQQQEAAVRAQQDKITDQLKQIYRRAQTSSADDFDRLVSQQAGQQARRITTSAYGQQLTAADKAALARFDSEESLRGRQQRLAHHLTEVRAHLHGAREQIQRDQFTIKNLAADGTPDELAQRQASLKAKIIQEAQQWMSYQLAIQWIDRALSLASVDRYPAVIKAAEKNFAILTGGHYQKIALTTKEVRVLDDQQEWYAVGELSTGTAEQLFVALRLGFISLMSDRLRLPIIIDDGFVNFDHQRRQRVIELLNALAVRNQVLYFTANDQARKLPGVLDLDRE